MHIPVIEEHYGLHRNSYAKRFGRRVGIPEMGEDLVQEAYTRVLKYQHSFNGEDFDKWFRTILNNVLRDYRNEEKGRNPVDFDEEEQEGLPGLDYPRHVMRDIFKLIQTKSLVQIEVLTLYFKQEYNAIEISQMTEHGYPMVRQIISRFRQECRELYGR